MSYPWLRTAWLRLLDSAQHQRLAHAYYMRHEPSQGSDQFLLTLANFLLCREPTKAACGHCKSCKLFHAGNHPDFYQIDASDESSIGIDEVRKLQSQLLQTANQGGARVAIIRPADKLTEQASNAILKVLEEPPRDMFWLLAVQQPAQLLPTLRSRMQWINLAMPAIAVDNAAESAQSLLNMFFDGALPPVIKNKDEATPWLDITERVLMDLHACCAGIADSRLRYPDLAHRYRTIAKQQTMEIEQLDKAVQQCRQLRQRFHHARGLNLPLLLSLYWQQWAAYGFTPRTAASI